MSDQKFILNYDLVTKLDLENAVITHELRKAEQALSKWLLDTRETATREALIKLGWTPPIDSGSVLNLLRAAKKMHSVCYEDGTWKGKYFIKAHELSEAANSLHIALKKFQ